MKRIFFLILTISIVFNSFSQQSYYNDVDLNLTSLTLKNALAEKITTSHTNILFYSPDVWEASKITDANVTNLNEVILFYGWENGSDADITNDLYRDNTLQDTGSGESFVWNREHVFSQSRAVPSLSTDDPGPGTDAHNLRPADRTRNTSRSNRKFTTGSNNSAIVTNGGWYPGDEWKGDVARIIMYMYLRYNGDGTKISETSCLPSNIGIGDASSTPDDMIDLFLQWNAEDPVSELEKKRNTYHENTANTYAQGNRNPFIDNPRLATRIWGGPDAEDTWGIYSITDTESPTVPTDLTISNITTFSVDVSWTAATDNIAVTSYDVFVNGALKTNVTTTSTTISNLDSNTMYSFSVLAKDITNNVSAQTSAVNANTLEDTQAPTTPTNTTISNQTGSTFIVTWDASTDNTAVVSYDIYIDGVLNGNSTDTAFTVTGLSISTTYTVQVLAKDAVNNSSNLSTSINGTTTDGSTTTADELFFSEYFEGSFGTNKALEIANVTSNPINLSEYSIKRNGNGGSSWSEPLNLSGTIVAGDVYVIINGSTTIEELIDEADFVQPNTSATNNGSPINFNGNDPVGLFKNDVLIDIIGVFNGGSANFAKDIVLRRKNDVIQPNTSFDLDNEWDEFAQETVDGIGSHNTTLKVKNYLKDRFSIYPNPVSDFLIIKKINNTQLNEAKIYSILGSEIASFKNLLEKIDVKFLNKGIYILKLVTNNETFSLKFIKK
jgi:endonuclease I/chitodextrinase